MNDISASVRRLQGDRIEVLFAKPLSATSPSAVKLKAHMAATGGNLIPEGDAIIGVETTESDYVKFLQSIDASKETITGFRRALDDSKKAQRARMRG